MSLLISEFMSLQSAPGFSSGPHYDDVICLQFVCLSHSRKCHVRITFKEFPQIWHKCSFGLKNEPVRSKVTGTSQICCIHIVADNILSCRLSPLQFFPYILLLVAVLMYTPALFWRFSAAPLLQSDLSFIMEELDRCYNRAVTLAKRLTASGLLTPDRYKRTPEITHKCTETFLSQAEGELRCSIAGQ